MVVTVNESNQNRTDLYADTGDKKYLLNLSANDSQPRRDTLGFPNSVKVLI